MDPSIGARPPPSRGRLALAAAGVALALVSVALVGLGSEPEELGAVAPADDGRPFSFRYPEGWNREGGEGFVVVSPGLVASIPIAFLSDSAPSYGETPRSDQFWFMAQDARAARDDLSAERLAEELSGADGIAGVVVGDGTIDGRPAQTVSIELVGPPYEQPLRAKYYFVALDETLVVVLAAAWSRPSDPEGRLLDAILGSIRFDETRLAAT
jgi:hypothetical protein